MTENRRSERAERRESVSIQIVSSSFDHSEPPRVASSETLDVSAGGVRLYVYQEVAKNAILDFCIEFTGNPRRFLLTGEVRWCHPGDNELYFIGIEILDAQGTDYREWQQMFDNQQVEV